VKFHPERVKAMAELAAMGWSSREIGEYFGCSHNGAQKALRRLGIRFRGRKGPRTEGLPRFNGELHSQSAQRFSRIDQEAQHQPRRCWHCQQITPGSGDCIHCGQTKLALDA
jgi:hypothetical protein